MSEKFNHKEYRSTLAKDLMNIEDHDERRRIAESEKNSARYQIAEELHDEEQKTTREVKQIAEKRLQEEEFEKRINEIANKKFSFGYIKEILQDNETPESYVYNGRRILRSTLQTLVEELKKTGFVKVKRNGWSSYKATDLEELETQEESYRLFVKSLNRMMVNYDELYDGSEEIYRGRKPDRF